jgi:hypothetical protein
VACDLAADLFSGAECTFRYGGAVRSPIKASYSLAPRCRNASSPPRSGTQKLLAEAALSMQSVSGLQTGTVLVTRLNGEAI